MAETAEEKKIRLQQEEEAKAREDATKAFVAAQEEAAKKQAELDEAQAKVDAAANEAGFNLIVPELPLPSTAEDLDYKTASFDKDGKLRVK